MTEETAERLHVVVRLDAAGDDITAPPMTFDATILAGAFLRAVRAVQVAYPVRLGPRWPGSGASAT